jgi:RNA polymerase sigma-70 factor (ECF subfamily)
MRPHTHTSTTPAGPVFKDTRWSVVLTAKDLSAPNCEQAMATLCEQYSYPVYAFIRRKGHSPHDAEDLAQGFFHRLIGKEFLRSVDREKGRFRTFLLTAVQRFLCNEWEKSQAQKRGGGALFVTWDADAAEQRYCQEPSHELSPEKLFDRRWALTLLEKAMQDSRKEYELAGNLALFNALQPYLLGDQNHDGYKALAGQLGMSEGSLRVAAYRLRKRYGILLREQIEETVEDAADVDDELNQLFAILSG